VKVNTPRSNSDAGFETILPRFGERRAGSLREAQSEVAAISSHTSPLTRPLIMRSMRAACMSTASICASETLRVTLDQVLA
jgi:hypothetical protein